jgi:hypothetical protein
MVERPERIIDAMTGPTPPPRPETPAAPSPPPPEKQGSGSGLRAPQGCAEWTVVVLGVVWAVLAIVFVVALVLRLSG